MLRVTNVIESPVKRTTTSSSGFGLKVTQRLLGMVMFMLLVGCASLKLQQPSVALENISPLSGTSLQPRIKVTLAITNPNSIALPLKGITYTIALNGIELIQGASNDLPSIPAYGTESVSITVGANLSAAPKLLMRFMINPTQKFDYAFKAKIDLKGPYPSFNIAEVGEIVINL